jgi:hypothetical protein
MPRLGQLARSCYERHFTPERVCRDYLDLYETAFVPTNRP